MKHLWTCVVLCLSTPGFALQQEPWFGYSFEMVFHPQYAYCFFNTVDRSTRPLEGRFSQHLLACDFECVCPNWWNWQVELEFADTTPISWGYRSAALQITGLWLDDVCGDLVSLTCGISYRDASSRLRRALMTPYHARANFELFTSVGKEWSRSQDWIYRVWGTFAVGQGTKGSPWLKGDLYVCCNVWDCHQLRLFARSYWGLGKETAVPLPAFSGWGEIGHRSIDLGGSYRHQFVYSGGLRLDYLYRVYARSYPERVSYFVLTYDLPFCPF